MLVLALVAGLTSADPGETDLVNASPALRGHVEWALGQFRSHGLDEPLVSSIAFAPDDPLCEDVAGYFYFEDSSILLCFDANTMLLGSDEQLHDRETRALLHELAHAWMQTHVSDEQQADFSAALGGRSWNDPQDPWCHRATEMAAEGFVWLLTDGEVLPAMHRSREPGELGAALAMLTGD